MRILDEFRILPQTTKSGMDEIIKIVRECKIPDDERVSYMFGSEIDVPMIDYSEHYLLNYFDLTKQMLIDKIVTDEFKIKNLIRYRIRGTKLRFFDWTMYCLWASIIYLKGISDLRGILQEISKAKVYVFHGTIPVTEKNARVTITGRELLNYFTKEDNCTQIFPVVKILAEYMDLPLKGKSLEEYKKAIIETCKEMIKESKNEN